MPVHVALPVCGMNLEGVGGIQISSEITWIGSTHFGIGTGGAESFICCCHSLNDQQWKAWK
uniref:Uncharacterized protein n=1 Tax=Salix viminalis TaxID=40686 RepID=A0A6N2KEU5_SALVM